MRKLLTSVAMTSMAFGQIAAIAQTSAPGTTAPAAAAPATPDTPPVDPKAAEKAAKIAAKLEAKRIADLKAKYGDGPYPDEIDAYAAKRAEALRPLYKTLYAGGERNAVLNFERLGYQAMEAGLYKDAAWSFDQALARIEAIYANNQQAAAARSVFHNEANKDFKGEPYERAMAYYYRGLLYLRQGDYGNARASFKSAEYQDTLSDSETFQSDFAIMNYLVGWTNRCEGQSAEADDAFAAAEKGQKGLVRPAATDNVLFIAELGNGPIKARDGAQAQKLVFRAGDAYPETGANIALVDGKRTLPINMIEASSVTYQATTRGGRAIDGLMNGKANWKEGTGAIGQAMITQGLMSNDSSGGYMAMAGLLFSAMSSAMKTKADARAWDHLPDLIMVGTARTEKPGWTYTAAYSGAKGPVELKDVSMRADAKTCSLVWMRSRPVVYDPAVPGEDQGVADAQNRKKPVQDKNKAFRVALDGAQL